MKKITKTILATVPAIMVAGMLVITSSATAAEDKSQTDRAAFARGAKAWSENCGRCHNIRAAGELNDEEWAVSVTHMRVRANIPGEVAKDIIAFLQASN